MTSQVVADVERSMARILLRLGAVSINAKQPFVYTSGVTSPIYTDNRILISYPDEREWVIAALVGRIAERVGIDNADVVAGTATAGIPFAAWLADRLRKPLIYVRSSAKEHGTGKLIEGRLRPGRRTIVIEDLITTGGSSLKTVDAIQQAEGVVSHCFALFTYGFEQARIGYQQRGVVAETLATISTLLDVAVDEQYIESDDRQQVEAWLASQQST